MSVGTLTAGLPVLEDRRDELLARVAALPEGTASPLLAVPGTHVARLSLVAGALVLNVKCDGDPAAWPLALDDHAPEVVALLRECCGVEPGELATTYRVRPAHEVAAEGRAAVGAVVAAVALHERFVRFAVRAQGMDDAELRRAFLEEFGAPA